MVEKGSYTLKAKTFDIETGKNIVVLNEDEAHDMDMIIGDRVSLKNGDKKCTAIVDVSDTLVKRGEIALFSDTSCGIGAKRGDIIEVSTTSNPASIEIIKKKMDGGSLGNEEIKKVIDEIMENKLSETELASFVTSLYIRGLSNDETVYLTNAIVGSGSILDIGVHPVVDKHCSGGVAGNRTTMILVPIIAAAGLYIPKTSARSITSPAGTADTMEVLAPVTFKLDEMKNVVLKTHGCVVWGGAMDLAAADDKLIRIRNSMRLDPKGVLLASILAKKKSVGAEYVVIDIPVGRGAKIEDTRVANGMARDFLEIGDRLEMKVECYITVGNGPIGNGIGPALEARDVLRVLQGEGPADLTEKSLVLAGALLELCGKVEKGKGYAVASDILKSGKALEKMREIIGAQGGNAKVKVDDIPIGNYKAEVKSEKEGRIHHVDNRIISRIARAAGAPKSKGAGIYMHVKQGDKVKVGDVLFDIIAESETKLSMALEISNVLEAVEMQKIVLEKYV
ncbi:AMP phosphorylase [Candidatus Micrarchaeota archaeon]|nr:AMP phosphorylase [Candidatus Micrarchaeota archaeon]